MKPLSFNSIYSRTGHVGWGISWYINGLLIPEINVVRGKTYTFVVEGGHDQEIPAQYHPFYITDDSVGGYEHKTEEEKAVINTNSLDDFAVDLNLVLLLSFPLFFASQRIERSHFRRGDTFKKRGSHSNRHWAIV